MSNENIELTCPGAGAITAEATTCSCLIAVPRALSKMDAFEQPLEDGVGVVGGDPFCFMGLQLGKNDGADDPPWWRGCGDIIGGSPDD